MLNYGLWCSSPYKSLRVISKNWTILFNLRVYFTFVLFMIQTGCKEMKFSIAISIVEHFYVLDILLQNMLEQTDIKFCGKNEL